MLISLVLAVVITILAAYVASNNLTPIAINFLGYPLKGTTGMLIVSAFGGGVLLGILLMLPAFISRSWALLRHRRKLEDLQGVLNRKSVDEEIEEE
jgi:uncharacterized membrane protein YciS (DUF1049 family)